MNAKSPLSEFARKIGAALILGTLVANSHGGSTTLANEPFTSGSVVKALPNVMFVLDDSGTMNRPYLPDWAGTWLAADNVTILTPTHRYFNGGFNGVAYNPATYYRPPVMYTGAGALDTTTYPSQTGQSVAAGGDATATAGTPNWRAVKVDAYGVLSAATANLEGNAFSYTTVAGEYCTSAQLRTCVASATPTGIYTFPAKLRWCDTLANSLVATTDAGTRCQAANIENSATNIANGVTPYTFARMPAPRIATITVTGTGSVTGITVDGLQILSAATGVGASATAVATAIVTNINACTYGLAGACGVVGYSATSLAGVVTIAAPAATSSTPVVTGGTTTAAAFAAPISPVTSTITVNSVGAITGITVSGTQILAYPTTAPAGAAAPVVTGVATTAPTTFSGSPNISTFTVSASGTVTSITVNGEKILAANAVGGTTSAVATAIVTQINACTAALTGVCTVAGYSASRSSSTVTITAPKPVVTGATTSTTTFGGSPNMATITVTGFASAVTNVTVGGLRITSASTGTAGITSVTLMAAAIRDKINDCTTGLSGACTVVGYSATSALGVVTITAPSNTTAVATQIAANINACTAGIVGACGVAGYRASSNGSVVTVVAPGATTVTPAISPSSYTTANAFGYGSVPGASLLTVITPSVTSYPFPGTAAKAAGRTDCAGDPCTYAEEMTNYANWYAYYHTRMQMMKTSAGIAFSSVDDQFRVGYSTINNGAGSDFINPSAFNGAQKNTWYSKFYSANAFGVTPLREALANTGRLYAGKLSTINGVAANDPMQYSCQQNFTILSTDGYWQDYGVNPKQIDGTTDVGEQDHNDPRPYYDGGTQTLTTSTTWWNDEQFAANTALYEQRTRQQRVTTSQLTDSSVTTTTWPYQLQTTQLRTRTTPLTQDTYNLISKSYPLIDTTRQLQKNETFIQSTTRPLESYTYQLTKVTTPLDKTTYNVTRATQLLTSNVFNVTRATQTVNKDVFNVTRATQLLTKNIYTVARATQLIDKKIYTVNSTTSPLQKSTFTLQKTTRQLQAMDNISTDGGDTWHDTVWTDVSSCTVTPGTVSTYVRNRRCQYNPTTVVTTGLGSCTTVTASPGPTNYTVAQSVACAYEAAVVTAVGSCTTGSASGSSPYSSYTTCAYGTAAAPVTGLSSCTANNQAGPSYTGDRVVCAYDASPTTTTGLSTCTWVVPSPSASASRTDCVYQAATNLTGQSTCSAVAAGSATTNGSVWNTAVGCSYDATPTATTGLSTCTWVVPSPAASASRTDCVYQSATNLTNQTTCTAATAGSATTNGSVWNTAVGCSYDASSTQTTGLATCTWVVPSPAASSPKTNCSYAAATNLAGQTTCTAAAAASATTNGSVWNTAVGCSYDGSATTTTTNLATCTWVAPATAAASPQTTCTYQAATNLAGQTSCSAVAQGSVTTNGTVWPTAVACSYDAAPTTTLTGQSSCTWVVPSPAASAPRTDCSYNAGAAVTQTNQSTCTPVTAGTATTNGSVWNGPSVTCNWQAAVVATGLTTCTPSGSAAGPPYNQYTTCGYGTGVVATGLSSCTKDAPEAGPSYTGGQTVACAYQATPVTTNVTVGNCTAVAQDTTNFSATGVTCTYAAATTPTVANCTDTPMSTGPVYTVLNSHSCAYSGTATTTNPAAGGICNANRQTTSPYTGPAIDCSYSATVSSTLANQTSCLQKNAQTGPAYTGGGRVNCTYGTTTGWSNVSSGTCTYKNPMTPLGSDGVNYVQGVECAYNATRVDTLVDSATCPAAAAAGESGTADGTVYSTLQKKVCVAGAFPSVAAPVVLTPVNTCNTTPVHTNLANAVYTDKATTCTYLAPVTVNGGTAGGGALPCVPVAASTGPAYVTSVSCPVTDTGWVPVTTSPLNTSCVTSGTPEPAPLVFDATSGQIGQCRSTDTTVYNATFPVGNPVAVPTCTVGVTDNTATGVQTTCVKPAASVTFPTINLAPVPVDPATCSPTTTPVAPAYIWTRCNPVTTTATVRGCNPVSPTSPLWETKTCADDGTGTRNTLADVAAYYYKTDLRTPALSNCSGAVLPATGLPGVLCSATNAMNNVPTTPSDPLSTQHMTTFTLGLGASGYMQYSSSYLTDTSGDFYTVKGVAPYLPDNGIAANPASGVCAWQSTNLCNWPIPVQNEQSTVDDLWHAGINGHGAYFSATDPTSLSSSITSALAGVAATGGSGASPTPSTASVKQGDNYFFNSTYRTVEWTGELVRQQINPVTATASAAIDWSAQAKLDNKLWTSRAIWTFDNTVPTTKLKAFSSTNFAANANFLAPHISTDPDGVTEFGLSQFLCTTPSTCLSATDQDTSHAAGANLVKYLMGDRSNEGGETDNSKYFRQRTHVLGDLVNAQVVYVNKVQYNYADPGYTAYIASQASRIATLYASANDGMLHAFRAKGSTATELLVEAAATAVNAAQLDQSNAALATAAAAAVSASDAAVAADTLIGQEIWAYIPTMVIPNLYKLADKKYMNRHRYFVDGSPTSGDICTSNCSGAAVWKTILVGGLGKGGRGYYALDITDPASPKALWEFTDTNLGYSYGSPQIAKLADGTWVVLVTSGYNNIPITGQPGTTGDGIGRLYVLDAVTGTLIRSISTGVGDTTTPSGLAKITAQVTSPDSDNTIEAVYAGDLLGNLWRFDVNNNIGDTGFDAQLMAVLKDGAGNPQPITTKPQVTSIPTTGEKLVIVGTGGYLDSADASNTNTQSVYAIKDSRATTVTAGTAIFDNPGGSPRLGTVASPVKSTAGFVRQIFTEETCPAGASTNICSAGELVRTATANAVNFATDNGWFFDLVTTGERANTDPALGLGALVINTNVPSSEACEVGGSSYQYGLNYLTGSAIGATSTSPLSSRVVGKLLATQLASSPTLLMTSSGKLVALTGLAGGGISIKLPALPPGASISRRTSWRELIRE